MRKGVFGLTYAFYAALAFILALLGQTTLCVLLLGFVIVMEKDEWVIRQVIQAAILSVVTPVISLGLGMLNIFQGVPFLGNAVSFFFSLISGVFVLIILIFVIIALVRVVKEQEADVPLANKFARWAYDLAEQRTSDSASPDPAQESQDSQDGR